MEKKDNTKKGINRRKFLGTSAVAAAGVSVLPSKVISGLGYKAPSDKLNIAGIGVGGIGFANLKECKGENIVALCDVDFAKAKGCFAHYPKAKQYKDFRQMLQKQKDIDAVIIATSDHTHAVATMAAMELGKHVYLQKPLTHSVWESRKLTEAAKKYGVATQMGNQGSSSDDIRRICEWIWSGKIGEIKSVHAGTNRPIWPQGLQTPTEKVKTPNTLDWDLFIGPAQYRPYHPSYTPWNWRGWWDFGTGALGDMACHILDPVFRALKLKYPTAVEGTSSQLMADSPPMAEYVTYYFPERSNLPKVGMPPVTVHWYDGGLFPVRPEELAPGVQIGGEKWAGGFAIFEGTKGKIMCGCYAKDPVLLPMSEMEHFEEPTPTIPRIKTSHEMDWVRACKEDKNSRTEAFSHFDYAGPFNEMVVMGVLAVRLQGLKRRLEWDGENMKFTNINSSDRISAVSKIDFKVVDGDPKFRNKVKNLNALEMANEWIRHTYREGWKQPWS